MSSFTKPIKPTPLCPECGEEMKVTGTKNQGEQRPFRIFQCMNVACTNRKRYKRTGEQL